MATELFAAKCFILLKPSNSAGIEAHFYKKKPAEVKKKQEGFSKEKKHCDEAFLDLLETAASSEGALPMSLIFDEYYAPIRQREDFLKRLQAVRSKGKLSIIQNEKRGLLQIEVTQ